MTSSLWRDTISLRGSMAEALSRHPGVAECAVIGVRDTLTTQLSVGMVVFKSGVTRSFTALRGNSSNSCATASAKCRMSDR
jgi:acyl-coenzyme A synthetase/AMP-(fatty) acid ligase